MRSLASNYHSVTVKIRFNKITRNEIHFVNGIHRTSSWDCNVKRSSPRFDSNNFNFFSSIFPSDSILRFESRNNGKIQFMLCDTGNGKSILSDSIVFLVAVLCMSCASKNSKHFLRFDWSIFCPLQIKSIRNISARLLMRALFLSTYERKR